MYSDVFCKVYNEFGWNYYPEAFGSELLEWIRLEGLQVDSTLDMACGTGVLSRIMQEAGIRSRGMDLSEGMIAIAREANPEASLTELAGMMDPPITKPAMNNRMKKLVQMAKEVTK